MSNTLLYTSIDETISKLKDQLWSQWNDLSGLNDEEVDDEMVSLISKHTSEFESLIELLVVSFNQSHRYFTLRWVKNLSSSKNDKLSLMKDGTDEDVEDSSAIEHEYSRILGYINWIHGYKRQLRESVLYIQETKLNTIDKLRDDTIESNLQTVATTQPDTGTYQLKNKQTSTRDQLLNKTQMLTNNLIKSNTFLQSSILQSDLNLDDLKQQTHSLTQVQDKYSQFEAIFNKTNNLVKSLEKASNQEKRDVYIALGFLCMAISWVVWRRIFKGPTKLFLWILFKFFKGILVSAGLVKRMTGGGSTTSDNIISGSVVVTEIASTLLSSHTTATATEDSAIEQAVNDAMDRIISHDEL
ncbi:protein transport protein Sec20p [Monosporozyma servazzii]